MVLPVISACINFPFRLLSRHSIQTWNYISMIELLRYCVKYYYNAKLIIMRHISDSNHK